MKVFISWSTERSKAVAVALRRWLPDVIQSVNPWMSTEDIEAGARWGSDVTTALEETRFGIICLTCDNQTAPWILFEAGALAKTIEKTCVVPYLIGIHPSDVQPGPLAQFQAKQANKSETWELVQTINRRLESPLADNQIERTFEKWWPELDKAIKNIPKIAQPQKRKRTSEDMAPEVLEIVRDIARLISDDIKPRIAAQEKELALIRTIMSTSALTSIDKDNFLSGIRMLTSSYSEIHNDPNSGRERLTETERLMKKMGIDYTKKSSEPIDLGELP